MKKILLAFDGSESSRKAIDYVSRQFAGIPDLHITLFHVLSGLPPEFWDDGHIFSAEEQRIRKNLVDKWLANQQQKFGPVFQEARAMLTKHGIKPEQIDAKHVSETIAMVPDCILAEAKAGNYETLVIGRCGLHHAKHLLLGDVARKIVHDGTGITICIVG